MFLYFHFQIISLSQSHLLINQEIGSHQYQTQPQNHQYQRNPK